ncbi:MAG: hypothetical protein JNJ83_00570 [Verrucomicrobiaceae bacterium]|nr:hypothetical protein [Verrucomicrobiaceae bacterium]
MTGFAAVYGIICLLGFLAVVIAASLAALWHGHVLVSSMVFDQGFRWQNVAAFAAMAVELWFCILLFRQMLTPAVKSQTRQELLTADQPHIHALMKDLSTRVGATPPASIIVDSSAELAATPGHLRIGLSTPVALSMNQFAGLLAHELAFLATGRGARAFRVMNWTDHWFLLRVRHDPWLKTFSSRKGRPIQRLSRIPMWLSVMIASLPMRLLHSLFTLAYKPVVHAQVSASDKCATALIGGPQYADALTLRARLSAFRQQCEDHYHQPEDPLAVTELPDNIPLLIGRRYHLSDVSALVTGVRNHWLRLAPDDLFRVQTAREASDSGVFDFSGSATQCVVSFHEQARRATHFHYQNDWGLVLSQIKMINVDECLHAGRDSNELVTTMNRYLKGLAHPERAFCGLTRERHNDSDDATLKRELRDCRSWLAKYGDRLTTSLSEWSRTWRLVRAIEAALALLNAGMTIHRQQFASGTTEGLREELQRQMDVMENLEGVLKDFESRLETLMACCLELLWRTPESELPDKISSIRKTLPHWVLIYEALGLNLPALRDLITAYHAFNALGAEVSGRVESAAFLMTVKTLVPRIMQHLARVTSALHDWPYPFATIDGQRMTLADHLGMTKFTADELAVSCAKSISGTDHKLAGQEVGRKLLETVSPFIDNYLDLYHQAFGWVTKATQLAEWHFVDPMMAMRLVDNLEIEPGVDETSIPALSA